MNHRRRCQTTTHALLIAVGLALSGCHSAGHRNRADAIFVTASPSLAESETKIVLELRDARQDLLLSEADAFLASDRGGKLTHALRYQLQERCENLRRTMPQARKELADGLTIIRPDPQRPYDDGNLVAYVAGKSDIHVLFTCAEISQLLAFKECADDLATIRYAHPWFDSARLGVLRDRVAALNLQVENTSPSRSEIERLKTEAATRVLERYLRDSDQPLPDGSPLLTSGPLSATRSPRLTTAFKDPSVVEALLRHHDPDALRALLFLISRQVIRLDYP